MQTLVVAGCDGNVRRRDRQVPFHLSRNIADTIHTFLIERVEGDADLPEAQYEKGGRRGKISSGPLITPPVGMITFALKSVVPSVRLSTIFRDLGPFVAMDIFRIALLTLVPSVVLVLV